MQDKQKNKEIILNNDDKGNPQERRLYRSKNKMIFGVCGGLAEFFNVDPTLIRLLVVFFAFAGIGSGVVAYIIAAIIMPQKPEKDI